MTEKSLFWYTDGFTGDIGDGAAPYTQEEFRLHNHATIGWGQNDRGVIQGAGNLLFVDGTTSPLSMDTGRAMVYGFPYWNDASLNLAVTTPVVNDTGGIVVLRATWSTSTVRATVVLNTDGNSAIPSVTQTAGTTWDIPLASFVIDTSGNIWTDASKTVSGPTSTRVFTQILYDSASLGVSSTGFLRVASEGIGTFELEDLGVTTAKIAAGAVTTAKLDTDSVDDTIVGERVPQIYRRQGGSATNWNTVGTTDYTPTTVRMQVGAGTTGNPSGSVTVTFPTAYSNEPLVFCQVHEYVTDVALMVVTAITTTGFTVASFDDAGAVETDVTFQWMAIGPQ